MKTIRKLWQNRQRYYDSFSNWISCLLYKWYHHRYSVVKYKLQNEYYLPVEVEDRWDFDLYTEIYRHYYTFDTSSGSVADRMIQCQVVEVVRNKLYYDQKTGDLGQDNEIFELYMPSRFREWRVLSRQIPFYGDNAYRVRHKHPNSTHGG